MPSTQLSRRKVLQLAAGSSAGVALAAAYQTHSAAAISGAAPGQVRAVADVGHSARITVEEIGAYPVARLNAVLTTELAEFSDFPISFPPAKNGVTLHRVTYPSVIPEKNNRPTIATGLIAVPDHATGALPVLSYQHGSVFGKTEVPSFPETSMETRLMIANFAGQGYMVIGADYFGRGLSPELNSYIVKASTQQACLDMLFATQAVSADLGVELGQLFVSGWSQGGWSALAFLNKLESAGIPVTAAAIASGPPDMYAIINRWVHAPSAIDATYIPPLIALMLYAYEAYYGLPGFANTAIKPEYQQATRDLYLNKRTIEQVAPLLPTRLPDLLQDEFKASISLGEDRYSRILQENHAYRWRSVTPTRVYYGGIDEVTPAYLAQLPVGYQQIMGGAEVTAVDAGPKADHRGTFLVGIQDQKQWFEQL